MIIEPDYPLAIFGTSIALILWAAFVLLVLATRHRNHWLKRLGLMAVTLNGALLWTTSAAMRFTGRLDPYLLNNWSRVFYAMFACYVLGFAWLSWRLPRSESDFTG